MDKEFDDRLRRALMETALECYQEALADESEVVFSKRYLREREEMLADPWKWYAKKHR